MNEFMHLRRCNLATTRLQWMVLFLVVALVVSFAPVNIAAAASITITVSPDHGPVGATITVSGDGAAPSSPIDIVIGNLDGTGGHVVATTTSGGAGRFSKSFDLPGDIGLAPGTLRGIWAVANRGTASESKSNIIVFAIDFGITVSPTNGALGTTVKVSSTNAPPDADITIFVGNTDGTNGVAVATARSGAHGVFSASFVLGNVSDIETNSDIGIFAHAAFGGPRGIPSNIVVFDVTQSTTPITFSNLQPAGWTTVSPGLQTLGATVTSGGNITSVVLQLSGVGTIISLGDQGTTQVSAFTSVDLGAGSYTLTMQATDSEEREFTAQWDFTVGSPGESQWFNSDGTVKSAEFNATVQSLVQAFRYHLFGQSWDDSMPEQMPTHATTITPGAPLGVWSPQNGQFDEQYTNATLTSLVQAFRWHLFGINWQTTGIPDMVTHATTFTGPEPIQPWFDSAGNPIRGNIEATLTSLVQAMRWHFFGFTWDGAHHDDIPTEVSGV